MCAIWLGTPLSHGQDAAPPLTPEQRIDLEYHAANLRSASAAPHRMQAARHLTRMRLPQANAVLGEALRSSDDVLIGAVISGLEAEPIVPFELLDSLLHIAPKADEDRIRAVAAIIGRMGERGGERAADHALNLEAGLEARAGVIRVLGELRDHSVVGAAVNALVQLIDPARNEPGSILSASYQSLIRLTGNEDFGPNPAQWEAWWDRTRPLPPEDWLPERMERLEQRVANLEREIDELRRRNETFQSRLDSTLNALYFRLLNESEQVMFTELAKWIGDDFAPVRRNAVNRADTRVANGQPLSDEIHTALAERVRSDTEADIRRRAARVLERENVVGLSTLVASVLGTDPSFECRRLYLEILERRPLADAAPTIVDLLAHNELRTRAARALVAHLDAGLVAEDLHERLRSAARDSFARRGESEVDTARLLARVAEPNDVQQIAALLDHEDAAVRRPVADMLAAHATAHEAILARANDGAVYPAALSITMRREADSLAAFDRILAMLPPTAAERDAWLTALRRIGEQLPTADLAAADQRLRAVRSDHLPSETVGPLREVMLARTLAIAPESMPRAERVSLLVGLSQVRIALGRHVDALAALDAATVALNGANETNNDGNNDNGNSGSASPNDATLNGLRGEVHRLRFNTLITLGRFDEAYQVESTPTLWLRVLAGIVDNAARGADPPAARSVDPAAASLRAEIERRFPDLEGGQLEEFNRLATIIDLSSAPDGAEGTSQRPGESERNGDDDAGDDGNLQP